MTAVQTGVRAFGTVHVLIESPVARIDQGVFRGEGLGAALLSQGATLVSDTSDAPASWPIVLIGPTTAAPTTPHRHVTLRSTWEGWIARVAASASPVAMSGPPCVLAAIGSAALAVCEAFGAVLDRPGSDAGYRHVFLNFWKPGSAIDHGPQFKHAPQWWWLVGLGHLGQAYGWVISLVPYFDPSAVEVMLQDTDATVPANHSHEIAAWSSSGTAQIAIPTAPAFQDLESRFETCGVVELAGKAVGASFVGVIAAVFAVAEATRELHGGHGLDVLSVNLSSDQIQLAESERAADVFSVPLKTG